MSVGVFYLFFLSSITYTMRRWQFDFSFPRTLVLHGGWSIDGFCGACEHAIHTTDQNRTRTRKGNSSRNLVWIWCWISISINIERAHDILHQKLIGAIRDQCLPWLKANSEWRSSGLTSSCTGGGRVNRACERRRCAQVLYDSGSDTHWAYLCVRRCVMVMCARW